MCSFIHNTCYINNNKKKCPVELDFNQRKFQKEASKKYRLEVALSVVTWKTGPCISLTTSLF